MAFFRRAFAHRFLNSAKPHFSPQTQSAHSPPPPPNVERVGPEGPWRAPRGRHDNNGGGGDGRKEIGGMSVEELRKVLRAAEVGAVRSRLRATRKESLPYDEFLGLCAEASCADHGPGIARSLEESGHVIALRNVVFLYPNQIAKAIESVLPGPRAREEELTEMEKTKAEIDERAEALVRRELRCGLGLFVLQTFGFMRLTFWELSWDVMEPVCFFVASSYFAAGYGFFLATSREPSFEGFFRSRLAAKQKRLMEERGFDPRRLQELRKVHSRVQGQSGGLGCPIRN